MNNPCLRSVQRSRNTSRRYLVTIKIRIILSCSLVLTGEVCIYVQALLDVESNADIRASLREVFFTGAKEIDAAGKKAICIQVPVPQQKTFQKIQVLNSTSCIHECVGY